MEGKIKNQIRRYRLKRVLTQRELMQLLGQKEQSRLSAWETGRKMPTLSNALRLSASLKCPIEVLFFPLFEEVRGEISKNRKKHQIKAF